MTTFEYLLTFFAILLGLIVADLALSLHRLLRARARVHWDWLPLAAALLVLLVAMQFWWSFHTTGRLELWATYAAFLLVVAALVSLFLVASAALPDEVPAEGLSLRSYYEDQRRYFWVLFTVFVFLGMATNAAASWGRASPAAIALFLLPNLVWMLLTGSLALVANRRYHAIIVVVMLVLVVGPYLDRRLDWNMPGGSAVGGQLEDAR